MCGRDRRWAQRGLGCRPAPTASVATRPCAVRRSGKPAGCPDSQPAEHSKKVAAHLQGALRLLDDKLLVVAAALEEDLHRGHGGWGGVGSAGEVGGWVDGLSASNGMLSKSRELHGMETRHRAHVGWEQSRATTGQQLLKTARHLT